MQGSFGFVETEKVPFITERASLRVPRPDNKRETRYIRNQRFAGTLCCLNAISWGRTGRCRDIHRRRRNRQARQIGWERLYRPARSPPRLAFESGKLISSKCNIFLIRRVTGPKRTMK